MKKLFFAVLIVFTFSLSTCTSDLYNPDICFQENVLPIFVSKCSMAGCHNSSNHEAHYDLTNYDGIMKGIVPKHPLQSELYNVMRGPNASMPPLNYPQLTGEPNFVLIGVSGIFGLLVIIMIYYIRMMKTIFLIFYYLKQDVNF